MSKDTAITLDTEALLSFVDSRWETSAIPKLKEYIPIPNKSPMFDPDWETNGYMQQAAQMLFDWACSVELDMQIEIFTLTGRTPIIFAQIPDSSGANNPDAPTVVLYGHYDKQPEFSGWHEGLGPWIAVERDGKLYGRGGADDGYSIFGSLIALEAIKKQGLEHPRCVLLIEGCEESGSFDLLYYMDAKFEEIGNAQLVVCLDAECGNYDQLWVTTSLRGMLPGTLSVDILHEGQHSGLAGGIVPSSFRILRQLIDRVEDASSGRLHAALNAEIPGEVHDAANQVAQVLGPSIIDRFPWVEGGHPGTDDVASLLVDNAWRPSLAVAGISGAPEVTDAGNTLRPGTAAKLVFRLPPTVDAKAAAQTIKAELERDPPYGASVLFELETPQSGWHAPLEAPWLATSLNQASSRYFGKPVMHMGIGGTIPFMKMLGDVFPTTQFMVTGLLGPMSNAHGPNEFMHIATAKRLTACVADVLVASHAAFKGAIETT
ncbi:MAG: M20/M25/M40 family metallo-hydrolase [Pseudomonadota bacterium]